MRLFWHKTISGNDFTPYCVFGCAWKIKFSGKAFQLTMCFMALTRKLVYISIFTTNHFRVLDAQRERERERERRSPHSLTHTELSLTPILSLTVVRLLSSVTHTDPLPHNSPSSTHSSLSTKRKPMVSFLFQLIHFSVQLHLTSDPHTFDLTSPHLRFTSPQTQICQNPPSNP